MLIVKWQFMHLMRNIGRVISIGLGGFLLLPFLVALGGQYVARHGGENTVIVVHGWLSGAHEAATIEGRKGVFVFLEADRAPLTGWHLWGLLGLLAVLGLVLGMVGIYALRFRKSAS